MTVFYDRRAPRRPARSLTLAAGAALLAGAAANAQPCTGIELFDRLADAKQVDAQFGWWVAGIGDVTDNGSGDIAVGARFMNGGPGVAAGAVFVYEGGNPAGTAPIALIRGLSANEHFGENIAGGADINGDGIPDFVVAAPLRNSGTGAVDIFLGGSPFSGDRWATLAEGTGDGWFGQGLAVGDVSGDGYADIIVGAPYNNTVGNGAGAVFIYRGGPIPPASPWMTFLGEGNNEHFGWAVAYVGDFTGNGHGDIAVGARLHGSGPGRARGKVYLFEGGPNMGTTPAGTWVGDMANAWFGNSIAAVGDVTGGGRPDLLVGAPYHAGGGLGAGAAYLFAGENAPGAPPVASYISQAPDAHLGWSVGGPGDVDGDGHADVLVGARLENVGARASAGRAYLFPGGASPSTSPMATFDGEAANDWLGHAVGGGIGFVNPEGAALAGSPYADDAASGAGAAEVHADCPTAPCYPDCDGNGTLDFFDFLCFQNAFLAGDPYADCDGNGTLDFFDFLCFQNEFLAGCP